MITREDIVNEATSWYETPYHHKARLKGVGVDCAMLVAGVAIQLNILPTDFVIPEYSVQWHLHNDEEKLLEILDGVNCIKLANKEDAQLGDILTFQYGRVTSHLGILINDNQIIHARVDFGKVVINDLDEDMLNRWTNTYRFPGVE